MRRRRIVTAGITVAAVGLLAAVTLPAVAGDHPTDGGPGTGQPAGTDGQPAGAHDDLVDALRRDLGVSAADARTRLATERWATRTVDVLRADLDAAYAGAWISRDGADLVVAVTDPAQLDRVRAAGAEARLVARSQQQLTGVKESLDRVGEAASPDLAGWYVDLADNTVVLLARPGAQAAARDFAAAAGVPADAVRVDASDEAPVPLFDVRGGDPYFIGAGGRCSVGFSVVGGFVTAGHCGRPGDTTTGFNQQAQGVFQASSFPGDDWAFVAVNDDWTPQPVVNDFNGNNLPVAGSVEAPVGASICRSGSTTGTRCGVIRAKDVTVNYPEGAVSGLTRTDVCAEPGDSGGAWLSGDQAQGVTSGGSGNCRSGGVTFFQPLAEILQVNNLTLVTTEDGAAPPTGAPTAVPTSAPTQPADPPQSPCADHTVLRDGELTRAGDRQIQPDGRFFRAGAGRHSACLQAPAGAAFRLTLQRFTADGWRTVARGDRAGATVTRLSFSGPAGAYRYRVQSGRGVGGYLLGFSVN